MHKISQQWRRLAAIFTLSITILLLVSGQTFLKSELTGKRYVIYWLFCLLFTVLSILLALVEVRFISEQSRREYKELKDKTIDDLKEIIISRKMDKKKGDISPQNDNER